MASINVNVNSEAEFNQQMQMYMAQGYSIQSSFDGNVVLKKKSYSLGLLIVLILFFFPGAIIYYLLASDDIVTIRHNNGQAPASNNVNANAGTNAKPFDLYCENCGHGLYNNSKFCPGCGKKLAESEEKPVEETAVEEVPKCKSCGRELPEGSVFCPDCGQKVDE